MRTDLASRAKAKVLALHTISKLLLDGVELLAGLSATNQLLGARLPPLARLEDGDEVTVAHEEVGLVAGDVNGDELGGESEGNADEARRLGLARKGEESESIACEG